MGHYASEIGPNDDFMDKWGGKDARSAGEDVGGQPAVPGENPPVATDPVVGIPVGPGGMELSHRTEMILADALECFKRWQRDVMKSGHMPNPEEIAQAWGSALWNAYAGRIKEEKEVFNRFGSGTKSWMGDAGASD